MNIFTIETIETVRRSYTVTAESEEQANKIVSKEILTNKSTGGCDLENEYVVGFEFVK
jgi:hypothetical protein